MKIKRYFWTLGIIIIVSLIVPLFVLSSRKTLTLEDLKSAEDLSFVFTDGVDLALESKDLDPAKDDDLEKSNNFAESIEKAELVVLATYTGRAYFTNDSISYEMKVDKVLKGQYHDDLLTFINRVAISNYNGEEEFNQSESIGFLNNNHQYLLLLKPLKNTYDVPLPEKMHDPFLLSTGSIFDFYDISAEKQSDIYVQNDNKSYKITDVKDSTQVLVSAKENLQIYNAEREKAKGFLK